jgi:glycosyltransferase involved in cell wall biosynthesis
MKYTKKQPLVSVIMPVFNAGKFLGPAIESIAYQTYKRMELIIVDDASTDDSWKTIRVYRKQYPKLIRAYRIPKQTNSAGNGATNFGLTKAKGEYIARMDADDISYAARIAKQVTYMTAHPATILVGTQANVIDKRGKIIGVKSVPTTHETIYNQFGILHPLIHPSVMIRRSLLPYTNKIYAMKWDVNDDYWTFFRLLNHGTFANLPDHLLKYRIHGNNLSLANPKEKFTNSVKIRLDAIRQLEYKMSLSGLLVMMGQYIIISMIPSGFIVPLYMFARGMSKQPQDSIRRWMTSFDKRTKIVSKVKKYYTYYIASLF